MPPKKKGATGKDADAGKIPTVLGRPGNNLKSGIVGLANVGKSTLFQAITKSDLGNPANFPYATIEPEEARVIVPDARFDKLCELAKPVGRVPANLTIFDIAGLTRGASTGEGLGNDFLNHIRAVDGIFQVVRCFEDSDIIHVEGDVNPTRDLDIIRKELQLKDIEFVQGSLEAQKKKTRQGGQSLQAKQAREDEAVMEKILAWLQSGKDVRVGTWGAKEVDVINPLNLLTAKPVVFILNMSEADYLSGKAKAVPSVEKWLNENNPGRAAALADLDENKKPKILVDPLIQLSVSFEDRLAKMEVADAEAELKKLGTESKLPEMILAMRKVLRLQSFFTVGRQEVRQWTIRKGATAPQAGSVIHTDFEKNFRNVDVHSYEDHVAHGNVTAVKKNGLQKSRGNDYIVMDGDILLFHEK